MAFRNGIPIEDIAICEAVQRGLASGAYEARRFSPSARTAFVIRALVHEHLTRPR